MEIVRFRLPGQAHPRTGVVRSGEIAEITTAASVADLLSLPLEQIRELCAEAVTTVCAAGSAEILAPVDGLTEVWAAGVTYRSSQRARVQESLHSGDVYDRVYGAVRPELFFKSTAWRVAGPGAPIAVRADSAVNVPEPELALVLNRHAEIVGYTVCNDVSSRSIEGENPLYLPQAKVYLGGCALGPAIRPAWEVADAYDLPITLDIHRGGTPVWHGEANTAQLNRRYDTLVEHLFRADVFPAGAVLATGTCLVPELPFTLLAGDEVRIRIGEVGELANPVVIGKDTLTGAAYAAAG
ncbi:fumarylacetoacetate hydrolase family protein [Streptomyces sp. NPDC020996]|uniref:fumarylacetoacetate hydrolase family protein n=1 Tax=Streptomyces sp. NPDC020996 TaxID=3154791 RepID=UPI00340FBFC8